jgi:hypothetical protein
MKTIAFEGVFTLFSAIRAFEAVRDAKESVELDLRRVTSFQDAALGTLAQAMLMGGPGQVVVRGLGHHQRRVLRYLGVNPDEFEPDPPRPLPPAQLIPEGSRAMAA